MKCCCDEEDVCIYHVIIYLFEDNWQINFNGKKYSKVKRGAWALRPIERKSILKTYINYQRSRTFRKLCHKFVYTAQHCRSDSHPNTCCKCYSCLYDNLQTTNHFAQIETGKLVKVAISKNCYGYVHPRSLFKSHKRK